MNALDWISTSIMWGIIVLAEMECPYPWFRASFAVMAIVGSVMIGRKSREVSHGG